ncbi:hypothetical protein JYU29_12320 [Tianweitania sp. BSSL-BM11]|uniref:Uncharacterized protein n=1 Tax=Tianweitania aestuarii TaxID=2814886 RepID=A0ABS5RWN7_9HYPH|nr:DUF6634 family protein [Tianweitania aestuarii]MBS9721470.1 hypothetical protein [Tianweitania aestuarii]
MLMFDPKRKTHGSAFNQALERLRILMADMEAVQAGLDPASLAGEPPLLNRWALTWRPAQCLTGHSTGHPLLPGGEREIITSDLQLLSRDGCWARTSSRWYRLGEPNDAQPMFVSRPQH